MHKSTSTRRKSFGPYAVASALLLAAGSAGALVIGVTPASAAQLATQPDTQIAVFMVPLLILVAAMLLEVGRVVLRGNLPAGVPARRTAPRLLSSGRGEG